MGLGPSERARGLLGLVREVGDMGTNVEMLESRRADQQQAEVLDVLALSDTPAVATDVAGHILFWNRAAERVLNRPGREVLGRRCYDVLAGRDVFGNRFCHENCSIVSMSRKGEAVQAFELVLTSPAKEEQALNVTILKVPSARPELFTLVHLLQPIDRTSRLSRALERLGASRPTPSPEAWPPVAASAGSLTASASAPPLTEREREILRWVAAGLQNKEVARKLGISLATVRNHIHNILEKLDVHSKLEAVSLAFRRGWVAGPSGDLDGRPS
jgi:DNA-binding CsgD family transcriptional regulator